MEQEPRQQKRYGPQLFFGAVLIGAVVFFVQQKDVSQKKVVIPKESPIEESTVSSQELFPPIETVPVDTVTHVSIPVPLKAAYLTGWSAGTPYMRDKVIALVEKTELNAVVIDIKDATGRLSYQPQDPTLVTLGVGTNRIRDLKDLIASLHEKGIYVIGRIAVFQDPFYARLHPEDAFVDLVTGELWRDYKGLSWLRPDSKNVWEYLILIADDAYAQGFDEINVDYVRYPSDGPLKTLARGTALSRSETIEQFFAFIGPRIKESGAVVSADLFGLTMSASDDLGIGQVLERIAPHVDFVAPMVYPSHFASGAYGIAQPALYPGIIVEKSLEKGIAKLEAQGISKEKLRPWLQDFNLGAVYTADMVRAQIVASEALGLSSWMLWDPANTYTENALLLEPDNTVY